MRNQIKLRVQQILFVICFKGSNAIGRSNFLWYSVPDLSTDKGYTVLSEIDTSVRGMKLAISIAKYRVDSWGEQVVISFPKDFSRGQFEAFIKAKKIVLLKLKGGVITFFHKIHDPYGFTLLSFDGSNVGFVRVAPYW